MKKMNLNCDLIELNNSELVKINGGDTPNKSTGLINDIAYGISFGINYCSKLLKAMASGARRGSAARYQNG